MTDAMRICEALNGHVRVNTTLKTVEIYNEFGVQLVLRDLPKEQYESFEKLYEKY